MSPLLQKALDKIRAQARAASNFIILSNIDLSPAVKATPPETYTLAGPSLFAKGLEAVAADKHHDGFLARDVYCLDSVLNKLGGTRDNAEVIVVLADLRCATVALLDQSNAQNQAAALIPAKTNMWHERWDTLSPVERAAWQVAALTQNLLDIVSKKENNWPVITVTAGKPDDVSTLAVEAEVVVHALAVKAEAFTASRWPSDLDDDDRARVECLIHDCQLRAGFYQKNRRRFRPKTYGEFWQTHEGGIDWYKWMYEARKRMHEDCIATIKQVEHETGHTSKVMDIGCGMGVGYCDALSGQTYIGVDLCESAINWCQEHRQNEKHKYQCRDTLSPGVVEELAGYDCEFVFSQGTVDNTWDIYNYIKAMRGITKIWLYFTAYRGWFPELACHRYNWQPDTSSFYNDLSPWLLERQLYELGLSVIRVFGTNVRLN